MKKLAKLTGKKMKVYVSRKYDKTAMEWTNPKPYTVRVPTHGLGRNIAIYQQLRMKPSLHGKHFAWSPKLRSVL